MALIGAFEKGGLVVLEDDELGLIPITYREALERCASVWKVESRLPRGRRTPRIQYLIEKILLAAIEAKKKAKPDWEPPSSVVSFLNAVRSGGRIINPGIPKS